jgi:hypothetical protein
MNLKIFIVLIAVALVVVMGFAFNRNSDEVEVASQQSTALQDETPTEQNCISEDCLKVENLEYPVGELPDSVVQALGSAIDDEYKARATYEAVINEFGSVRPFSMIIRAEEQHISSLKAIYDKYGLDIPSDPYTNVEIASTKSENCSVGVQAEIDNAALYRDSLLPAVEEYPDIASVFTQLMNASQDNHLPAFERCAN